MVIEIPEATTLSLQLADYLIGKRVDDVLPPTKPHAFCWFNAETGAYRDWLVTATVTGAEHKSAFVSILFDNGKYLTVHEGVNMRLSQHDKLPNDYNLALTFTDGTALVLKVAMYGGIYVHNADFAYEYYQKACAAISPFDEAFEAYYYQMLDTFSPTKSVKTFMATEQRFCGLGNGVLQDILFAAKLHPKRLVGTLSPLEKEVLLKSMRAVVAEMSALGGRSTEKDLLGAKGGYVAVMSAKTAGRPCPVCGNEIVKEAYMGGSIYYCPHCQVK